MCRTVDGAGDPRHNVKRGEPVRSLRRWVRWADSCNDFFHDLAAGFFPGAAIAAWLVQRQAGAAGRGGLPPQAVGGIWMLLVLGLAVSVGTGIFRLRYHLNHVKPELVKARNDTAFTKHIMFIVTLVAAGILFGIVAAA